MQPKFKSQSLINIWGWIFCKNNYWIMENMDKGLTVPKWVLIIWPKIGQNVCPSPKISDFWKKALSGCLCPCSKVSKKTLNSNFRYHQWHLWLLGLSLLPAMGMGIIAALFVEHRVEPNGRFGVPQPSRPGCFVPADPFKVN